MASSSTLSSLTQDLLEKILLKIPADALVRAKPTCKQWRDLINEKRFIYKHLELSPERLLRTDERRFLRISETTVQIMDLVTRPPSFSPLPDELQPASLSSIGALLHCDGLMLCVLDSNKSELAILALWNPLTTKFKRVEHRLPSWRAFYDYFGIGYDINKPRHDYKILRFAPRHKPAVVEIYECNSNSWRTLDDAKVDWDIYPGPGCRGVPVMGNMYWLVKEKESRKRNYVLCFDFSVETFKDICFCHLPYANNFLGCYDGDKLSLLEQNQEPTSPIEVWVSSRLADGNVSFRQYFRVDSPDLPSLRTFSHRDYPVYCIANNKSIIVLCEGEVEGGWGPTCITLYEIDEGGEVCYRRVTERHYSSVDYACTFFCGYVYVPSLIPLP